MVLSVPQNYPRIERETDKFNGFLDESRLTQHTHKIPTKELKRIILDAIQYANGKSSREILNVPENATEAEVRTTYTKLGKKLFDYFIRYYDDPASALTSV